MDFDTREKELQKQEIQRKGIEELIKKLVEEANLPLKRAFHYNNEEKMVESVKIVVEKVFDKKYVKKSVEDLVKNDVILEDIIGNTATKILKTRKAVEQWGITFDKYNQIIYELRASHNIQYEMTTNAILAMKECILAQELKRNLNHSGQIENKSDNSKKNIKNFDEFKEL